MNNKNKLFTVVLILCVISLLLGILSPVNKKIQSKKNSVSIKEIVAQNNKIAVIKLDGVISSESAKTVFGEEENSSLVALSALNSAEDDKNVKGVILRINSRAVRSECLKDSILLLLISERKNLLLRLWTILQQAADTTWQAQQTELLHFLEL